MTSRLQARLLAQRSLFQRLQGSKKRSKLQAGFTLIELLVVIAIIGILSGIALPTFLNQREKANIASADAVTSAIARKCAAEILTDQDFTEVDADVSAANTENDGFNIAAATCTANGATYTYTTSGANSASWVVGSDGKVRKGQAQ